MWVITAVAPQFYHTPTAFRYNNGFAPKGQHSANFPLIYYNMNRMKESQKQRRDRRRGIKVVFVWHISLQGACLEIKDWADFICWQEVNEVRQDTGAVCSAGEWSSTGRSHTHLFSFSLTFIKVTSQSPNPLSSPWTQKQGSDCVGVKRPEISPSLDSLLL